MNSKYFKFVHLRVIKLEDNEIFFNIKNSHRTSFYAGVKLLLNQIEEKNFVFEYILEPSDAYKRGNRKKKKRENFSLRIFSVSFYIIHLSLVVHAFDAETLRKIFI